MSTLKNATQCTLLIGLCLAASSARADVVLDGTIGDVGKLTLSGNDIQITEGMGKVSGSNLFHSFQTFDLAQGQNANFSADSPVNNIIGRITGGTQSQIFGSISSTVPGANLYLLNPNGILFGSNSSVNISGSFHASTADSLKFADGYVFYSDPANDASPLLTTAAPTSFGFLSATPAAITVDNSQLSVGVGNTLSLVAGDLNFSNGASVTAEDGQVNLVSVASAGDVDFGNGDIQMNSFQDLGNISLSTNSLVSSSGNGGGRIVIRGGQLVLDSSNIAADTTGTGTTNLNAGIDIVLNGDLKLDHDAHISTNVKKPASGDSNGIIIEMGEAGNILIDNRSSIESLTEGSFFSSSTGNGGDIDIKTNDVVIKNFSTISTRAKGKGNAGNIYVTSNNLTIDGPLGNSEPDNADEQKVTGIDASSTFSGGGYSGNIIIYANDLSVSNAARIRNNVFRDNDAGNINIDASSLEVSSGARIESLSTGSGKAGNINLNVENNITVSGVYKKPGLIDTLPSEVEESQIVTNAGGDQGNININANTLEVLDGAKISAHKSLIGNNDAGNILISANKIVVSGVNQEFYENLIINDHLPEIAFSQAVSAINTDANGFGENLGTFPSTEGENLNAGNIVINTGSLILKDGGQLSAQLVGAEFDNKNISKAGQINIYAIDMSLTNGAKIISGSKNGGNAGSISIESGDVLMDGNTAFGTLTVGQSTGLFSSAKTKLEANAGDITIISSQLELKNGAIITSESSGLGAGGNIQINSNVLQLQSKSKISSNASNSGTAGNVNVLIANELKLLDSSITTQANLSDGGDVSIKSNNLIYLKTSNISTKVESGEGNGGNIDLDSQSVVIDKSNIVASAVGGNGGNINIKSNQIYITPDSVIRATSVSAIDGEINIQNLLESNANLLFVVSEIEPSLVLSKNECEIYNQDFGSLYVSTNKTASSGILDSMLSETFEVGRKIYTYDSFDSIENNESIVSRVAHRKQQSVKSKIEDSKGCQRERT